MLPWIVVYCVSVARKTSEFINIGWKNVPIRQQKKNFVLSQILSMHESKFPNQFIVVRMFSIC